MIIYAKIKNVKESKVLIIPKWKFRFINSAGRKSNTFILIDTPKLYIILISHNIYVKNIRARIAFDFYKK